jgi:hypothetical protein
MYGDEPRIWLRQPMPRVSFSAANPKGKRAHLYERYMHILLTFPKSLPEIVFPNFPFPAERVQLRERPIQRTPDKSPRSARRRIKWYFRGRECRERAKLGWSQGATTLLRDSVRRSLGPEVYAQAHRRDPSVASRSSQTAQQNHHRP